MNIAKRIASKVSLKERMRLLIILTVIPLTVMVLGIVAMIYNYSGSYNRIMANLKVINTYNMNFKSDMEYSMYRVMIGLINTKEFENGDILEGESVCHGSKKSVSHDRGGPVRHGKTDYKNSWQ